MIFLIISSTAYVIDTFYVWYCTVLLLYQKIYLIYLYVGLIFYDFIGPKSVITDFLEKDLSQPYLLNIVHRQKIKRKSVHFHLAFLHQYPFLDLDSTSVYNLEFQRKENHMNPRGIFITISSGSTSFNLFIYLII